MIINDGQYIFHTIRLIPFIDVKGHDWSEFLHTTKYINDG